MTRITNLSTHSEQFVSVAELAAYWHVTRRTIYRDIYKGALTVVRVGSSGLIRIPTDEARRYGRPDGTPVSIAQRSTPPVAAQTSDRLQADVAYLVDLMRGEPAERPADEEKTATTVTVATTNL